MADRGKFKLEIRIRSLIATRFSPQRAPACTVISALIQPRLYLP
jgi:hypothetical protein